MQRRPHFAGVAAAVAQAQLLPLHVAARDEELQSYKKGAATTPVQFFGDTSKSWWVARGGSWL